MTDLRGKQIGQYIIKDILGRGGMATVYLAHQPSMARDVAIKVIKPGLADREDFPIQLQREGQVVSSLQHPYIVKIFDFGQHEGMVYLVMELFTGGSLAKSIAVNGRIGLDATGRMLDQIASALEYAHEKGIIHRDIKPQNIILDEKGNAYVADFGIALLLVDTPNVTENGPVVGTPAYIPPEQWLGEPADSQSDIYSLGVVLFQMLTGRTPFITDNLPALMKMHLDRHPPSIKEFVPELPADLDWVIGKAMAKERQDRIKSAVELAMMFRGVTRDRFNSPVIYDPLARDGTPKTPVPNMELGNDQAISLEKVLRQERDAVTRIMEEADLSLIAGNTPRPFVGLRPQEVGARFQGRVKHQDRIKKLIMEGARLIGIYGRGGIGKTALACKVLGDLEKEPEEARPKGMVYLSANARDATDKGITLDRIFAGFARLLLGSSRDAAKAMWRDPHVPAAQKVAMLLNELWDGRYLLLLDNLENVQDPDTHALLDPDMQTFIEMAVERSSNLCILVTSREPLALPRTLRTWEQTIELNEGLPTKDAVAVLRAFDPSGLAGLRDASAAKLKILAERTGGFPRALEAVAGLLLEDPLTDIDDLINNPQLLAHEIASEIVQKAIIRLSPAAVRVMEALALFGRPVPDVALAFLLAPHLDTTDLRMLLNRLVQAYFVSFNPKGRLFDLHPIDREYCYDRIPAGRPTDAESSETPEPYSRIALHRRAARYYERIRKPKEKWLSLEDLAPQLAEFEHLTQAEAYDDAARLVFGFDVSHLHLWGHYGLAIAMHETLIGKTRDSMLVRSSINNLGLTYERVGRIDEALSCYLQALESARQDSHRRHEGAALGNVANVLLAYRGQVNEAIRLYQEKAEISREINNQREESIVMGNLGLAHFYLGLTEDAIELYHQALVISQVAGDPAWRVMLLSNLGEAEIASGKIEQGLSTLEQAYNEADKLNDWRGKSHSAYNLAIGYLSLEKLDKASFMISIAQTNNIYETNYSVAAIEGLIMLRLGKTDTGLKSFENSVRLATEILSISSDLYPVLYARGLAYSGLATICDKEEYAYLAIADYKKAKTICGQLGLIAYHAKLLNMLIDLKINEKPASIRDRFFEE